jgi:hypothetical protein
MSFSGSSGMKIFLFTTDDTDCPVSNNGDLISTKIGSLADASTKGVPADNFALVHAVLEAAFLAVPAGKRPAGYRIEAYATAGNRIISVVDDVSSWQQFRNYFHVTAEKSKTLHGTQEAMLEFIAVNFSHRRNRNFVPQNLWYNMISTGGASLQLGLVYRAHMFRYLQEFFSKVVQAALFCNTETSPFDWIDVFSATDNDGVMEFESVFKDVIEAYAEHVIDIEKKMKMKMKEEDDNQVSIQKLARGESIGELTKEMLFEISIQNEKDMIKLKDQLAYIYGQFPEIIHERCEKDRQACFIGISFLGILNARGNCSPKKLEAGYHIIAGVDKFRILYEVVYGEAIDARTTMLSGPQQTKVEELLTLDNLFAPLRNLVGDTAGIGSLSNKEFLPAGNWGTGLRIHQGADRPMLAVMVQKLTVGLGILDRMVDPDRRIERKTDWTFGAAWLMQSYYTCRLGVDVNAVRGLPRADFVLEEQSVSSLENMLSSFL